MELQRLLSECLSDAVLGMAVERLAHKLEAKGLSLTSAERRRLGQFLTTPSGETLVLHRWRWWDRKRVVVEWTDADSGALEDDWLRVRSLLPQIMGDVAEQIVPSLAADLRKAFANNRRRAERTKDRARRELAGSWKEPLTSFGLLIELAIHVCETSNAARGEQENTSENALADALLGLQARSVEVAEEIKALLRAGYAHGAMARWRTAHELAVTMAFLEKHGEECARRFLDHAPVDGLRVLKQYQQIAGRLGFNGPTDADMIIAERERSRVVRLHGEGFARRYGWAIPYFAGRKELTFADIERDVELDYIRPFYRTASDSVHATPCGISEMVSGSEETTLLVGPADYGIAQPGQYAGLALVLSTAACLQVHPTFDTLVVSQAMELIAERASREWLEAEALVDAES